MPTEEYTYCIVAVTGPAEWRSIFAPYEFDTATIVRTDISHREIIDAANHFAATLDADEPFLIIREAPTADVFVYRATDSGLARFVNSIYDLGPNLTRLKQAISNRHSARG